MMKVFDKLNRKNFKLYAAQHYNNPECLDVNEFREDLSRFKYVKRLLSRYEAHSDLQERLILNHLIVIYNCYVCLVIKIKHMEESNENNRFRATRNRQNNHTTKQSR